MDGLGISPLGDELGPYGGPGLITIKGVVPIGRRVVSVVLDRVPKLRNDGAWNDASDLTNYLFEPIDPTVTTTEGVPYIPQGKTKATHAIAIIGATIYPDDREQVLLETDCTMERGVEYEVSVLYIRGEAGEVFAGPTSWSFKALAPGKVEGKKFALQQAPDPYYDIANSFYALDKSGTPALTGWQQTNDQNLVHHGGLANARKRINRRMFAGRGRYLIYGAGYGVDWPVGRLAKPGDLARLENAIAEQIRQEPDVKSVSVTAKIVIPNSIDIQAYADIRPFGPTVVRQVVAIS